MSKLSLYFLLITGLVGTICESDAKVTSEFFKRHYKNAKELECNGLFRENNYLRLELICSECGIWLNHYQYTQNCRERCYTTSHFKDCLKALQTPVSFLEAHRNLIKSLAGRQPDF